MNAKPITEHNAPADVELKKIEEAKLLLERGCFRLFAIYQVELAVVELSKLSKIHLHGAALPMSSRLLNLRLEEETTYSAKTRKNTIHGVWSPADAALAYAALEALCYPQNNKSR